MYHNKIRKKRKFVFMMVTSLASASVFQVNILGAETPNDAIRVSQKIESMSIEEKVAQLFIVTPEALTDVDRVTMAGEQTREAFYQYPVGGLVYFADNFLSEEQLTEMLDAVQQYSYEALQIPVFTCVDEEGGTVTRISGKEIFDVPDIRSMKEVGEGGSEEAYKTGKEIGEYLNHFGFWVDFAPVADVATNSDNTLIGSRAFGSEPDSVAALVVAFMNGMHTQNVATTLKHFPGHGNTSEDSHYTSAVSYKTVEELEKCEFVPFRAGIREGTEFIMVGHISLPNVTGDSIPATLSYEIVTDILREKLGYDGIVVTDAMNMAAITNYYSSDEAAIKALQAGVDMILMPYDFKSAYQGVIDAISNGKIAAERIDESVKRILQLKYVMLDAK